MNHIESPQPELVDALSAAAVSPSTQKGLFHFWRCFWLSFLVISLGYAWYCFYVPSNDIAWANSHTVAARRAVKTDKPMILFFTGQWCVPCRIMKRTVWADPQVAAKVNTAFIPVMIDVDDPSSDALKQQYAVGAPPTTVIVDSQGQTLQQRYGGMAKAEFLELLNQL